MALKRSDGTECVIQSGVDTCCISQIIEADYVPEGIQVMTCSNSSTSRGSNRSLLDVQGVTMLPLRIKTSEVTLLLNVFKDLAVPLLHGTPFMDSYILGFSPREHTIRLTNARKIDIVDHDERAAPVRVVQDAYLAPMSEMFVRCRTNRTGVSLLRRAHRRLETLSAANGVIETEDGFPNVRLANFSNTGCMISPGALLGVTPHIEVLTSLAEEEVQTVVAWVQELDLSHLSQKERGEVLAMLEKYSILFDSTDLGPMAGPKHEIQTGNARPVRQAP